MSVSVCACDLHSVFIHSIASEQATTLSSDSTQQQQPAVLADEEVDSDEPKASNTALTVLSYIDTVFNCSTYCTLAAMKVLKNQK